MINKIDHIGIAVKSLDQTLPFYTDVLKLPLQAIEEVKTQKVKVAFLLAGNCKIELLEPTSPDSPVSKFIEKRGEGIHHVAVGVNDIQERIVELMEQGIPMIDNAPREGAGGANIAFLHPKAASGVLYELCEKVGEKHDG